MPRLFVLSGNDLGQSFEFDRDVSVGRAADVTVRAPSISRKHAQLELEDDVWYVRDLGSRNGVFVDGERTQRAALHDGAIFRLGEVELRFRAKETAPQTSAEPVTAEEPVEPQDEIEFTTETEYRPAPPAEEIELEGEWDDSPPPPPVAPTAPPPAAARPAVKAKNEAAAARAEAMGGGVRGEQKTTSGGRVLQYHRIENRGGLMNADLAQQPLWLRALVYVFAAALMVGLTYGAFLAVRMLRG